MDEWYFVRFEFELSFRGIFHIAPDPIIHKYHKTSNISRTLVCNKIVDHSDVVGASPAGTAPTTSSYLT